MQRQYRELTVVRCQNHTIITSDLWTDEKTVLKKVKLISTDTKGVEEPKDPDSSHLYHIMKLFLTRKKDKKSERTLRKVDADMDL